MTKSRKTNFHLAPASIVALLMHQPIPCLLKVLAGKWLLPARCDVSRLVMPGCENLYASREIHEINLPVWSRVNQEKGTSWINLDGLTNSLDGYKMNRRGRNTVPKVSRKVYLR